jgi:hypothetical protein
MLACSSNFIASAHVSRFLGQNTGVVQLDAMAQVYDGSHGRLLRMVEMDVSAVLYDLRLNRTCSLSDVHLSTLTGDAVYTWHF